MAKPAQLYETTRDVYQVEKALGHANVAVTETYLQSLGLFGGSNYHRGPLLTSGRRLSEACHITEGTK